MYILFFFSSRRRHTRCSRDWSSDVCSSDLGSKALRAAIDAVFGTESPVQRCRHHKLENVSGYLPEELKDQVKAAMRAAFRLPAKEGMAKLEKQAQWLEHEYPSAAASLREGLAEMFT